MGGQFCSGRLYTPVSVDNFEVKLENLLKKRAIQHLDEASKEEVLIANKKFKFHEKNHSDTWKSILRFHSEHGRFRLKDLKFHLIDELEENFIISFTLFFPNVLLTLESWRHLCLFLHPAQRSLSLSAFLRVSLQSFTEPFWRVKIT